MKHCFNKSKQLLNKIILRFVHINLGFNFSSSKNNKKIIRKIRRKTENKESILLYF